MSVMTKDFETMTAAHAYETYGWGITLKCMTTVFHRKVDNTDIWVARNHETECPYYCEVECDGLVSSWDGWTPYDAMLNALVLPVMSRSIREEWDEPIADGLKCSREDVIDAMAQYAYVLYTYGYDKLDEMFPNGPEGRPIEGAEVELYEDLRVAADDMLSERL